MLFRILDNLRTKQKEVRKQVAFFSAIAFTGVIALVWTLTLPERFAEIDKFAEAETKAPFSGMWQQVKKRFGEVPQPAAVVATDMASTSEDITATSTFDALLLLSTSTDEVLPTPKPIPVLIGTTSSSS